MSILSTSFFKQLYGTVRYPYNTYVRVKDLISNFTAFFDNTIAAYEGQVFVSSTSGDDTTGVVGNPFQPFKTIKAAETAMIASSFYINSVAESGSCDKGTVIIGSGRYDEYGLGKDELTYKFLEGARLSNTSATSTFNDIGKGAIQFRITGPYKGWTHNNANSYTISNYTGNASPVVEMQESSIVYLENITLYGASAPIILFSS